MMKRVVTVLIPLLLFVGCGRSEITGVREENRRPTVEAPGTTGTQVVRITLTKRVYPKDWGYTKATFEWEVFPAGSLLALLRPKLSCTVRLAGDPEAGGPNGATWYPFRDGAACTIVGGDTEGYTVRLTGLDPAKFSEAKIELEIDSTLAVSR